jgi:dTDP-4-dehydrorhamnose reductase
VVGASGQVGNQIVMVLGDNAQRGGRTLKAPTGEDGGWVHADLVSFAKNPDLAKRLIDRHSPSAIYCVGGATDVERCETERDWAMDTNCHGPAALAQAAQDIPFVYFSTEYVFDGKNGPYEEESETHALSVYGCSKLSGERAILKAHGSPLIIRTTVVYGFDVAGKNFLYALRRRLGAGEVMRVPSDQVSTPTYNRDLAVATVELVRSAQSGVFHVCGPELLSRYEFALLAASELGLDCDLVRSARTLELGQKAPRPLKAGLSTAKLGRELPQVKMRSNKEAIADWMRQEAG